MKSFVLHSVLLCWSASALFGQTGSFLAKEGTKRVNGVSLYYKTIGSGEPVIVIHGGPGLDHSYLLPQMAELSEKHRLIFFDQRASGRSSIPGDTSAMSLRYLVEDIEGIRKSFALESVSILAHSWGCLLALRYALQYPDHIKSLILVSPVPGSSTYAAETAAKMAQRVSAEDSLAMAKLMASQRFKRRRVGALEDYFRLTFRSTMDDPANASKITLTFPRDYVRRSSYLKYLGPESMQFDLYPLLPEIKVKTLLVVGNADPTPREATERLHQAIPQSRLEVIPHCGHFPYIEQPGDFRRLVEEFLAP